MENSGWEVAFSTSNIKTKNFTWNTTINLGFNNNKILNESVAENATYPSREGYSVGAIFALPTAGLDEDGYPLFLSSKGEKQTAEEFMERNKNATEEKINKCYPEVDGRVMGGRGVLSSPGKITASLLKRPSFFSIVWSWGVVFERSHPEILACSMGALASGVGDVQRLVRAM
jgi:hypothetical protein